MRSGSKYIHCLALCLLLSVCAAAKAQRIGVQLVGRWLVSESGATATYAGSEVLLTFSDSRSVAADFVVSNTQRNSQDLYIAVSVDGGKRTRWGLSPGVHSGLVLANGLSSGPHVVSIRKEGEPYFGALRFGNPALGPKGKWRDIRDDRPIVEVLGDSDATGICALGPDSPAAAATLFTSAWASESASWVGLLEAGLAGAGHPVDMVDLALSGSDAKQEADAYDYTALSYSDARFVDYSPPGRRHAALVLMWGGANDRHGGGDAAGGGVAYANLSAFQLGIYAQLKKVLARNPDVRIVLLDYIDVAIPDWRYAYAQVLSLFPEAQQRRIFQLAVHDPKGLSDACDIDPKGHPNRSMHEAWASQILAWMLSADVLQQLGFSTEPHWDDER
jgi:hypothetical protein